MMHYQDDKNTEHNNMPRGSALVDNVSASKWTNASSN